MNLKISTFIFLLLLSFTAARAQYVFTDEIKIPCTNIKNQQMTGTCWSFGTTSFIESEILRLTKSSVDISEMYNVRKAYSEKARNYVLRQGTANFGEGGLSHDVLRNIGQNGIVPQSAYSGLVGGDTVFDHGELSAGLKGYLDAVIQAGHPSVHWQGAVEGMLDSYLGPAPSAFTYDGKTYDPHSFCRLPEDRSQRLLFVHFVFSPSIPPVFHPGDP